MRPVIGITCDEDWGNRRSQIYAGYYEGVFHYGGQPFLIPCCRGARAADILASLDGLLLSGGQDVDAYLFGEEPHPKIGAVLPDRDSLELELARQAEAAALPVLGICRGAQVMNIALGGDIYQDLPSQWQGAPLICHDQQGPKGFGIHEVMVHPETQLRRILGCDLLRANSFHHQAVRRLGRNLIPSAKTRDGVIEAIEHRDQACYLGVQWHPERMWKSDPVMGNLFAHLVETARNKKKG